MIALILAAGFSQRMGEITHSTPKTLLKVGSTTILDNIINKLNKIDVIEQIYVLSNQYYYNRFADWEKTNSGKKETILINNGVTKPENKKGFVGDLLDFIRMNNKDDLLVIAADNLFDFDLNSIVDFFYLKKAITFGLIDVKDPKKLIGWEAVTLNKHNKITTIETASEDSKSSLTTFGLYIFPKNKLPPLLTFLKNNKNLDSAGEFINWLTKNNTVYGYAFLGKWFDVGTKKILHEARQNFVGNK
jgi:glucose-1-phosphate thymidylyltransferase